MTPAESLAVAISTREQFRQLCEDALAGRSYSDVPCREILAAFERIRQRMNKVADASGCFSICVELDEVSMGPMP